MSNREITILSALADYAGQLRRRGDHEAARVALDEEARLRRRIEKMSAELPADTHMEAGPCDS